MTASVTEQVALDRIGQIAINVKDLARAVRFYRDTLGMRFLFEVPNLAFFDCGGVRLMLGWRRGRNSTTPGSVTVLQGTDMNATFDALKARRGVHRQAAPHREDGGPRPLDGVLPGHGRKHARADVRDAALGSAPAATGRRPAPRPR